MKRTRRVRWWASGPRGVGPALILLVGMLLVSLPMGTGAASLTIEAEVMEGSEGVEVPGLSPGTVRYAVVHHKHLQDQPKLSEWLRTKGRGSVHFATRDGTVHRGVLQRLKHCFGRGLLIYAETIPLQEKDVVLLELPQG